MPEVVVSRWRIFCDTESGWVYNWSVDAPTACPNDTAHLVNADSITLVSQIGENDVKITNTSKTLFLEDVMVEKTTVIDLKSFYPLSNLKNITSGTVVHDLSEIKLSTTTSTDSISSIVSRERGIYISGTICEAGIAVRIPADLVGDQTFKFGYFDADNGFYFKVSSSGVLSCCVLKSGTHTETIRADFNNYKLDGTEQNGVNLDLSKGNIFKIRFSWYGYGAVEFGIVANGPDNIQKTFIFHKYFTSGGTSTSIPNLPITAVIENNGETTVKDVFVAGRQFSILGKPTVIKRENMFYRRNTSISSTLSPIFSLTKKPDFTFCKVVIAQITLKSNVDALVYIISDPTLTGSSFSANPYATSAETSIEVDTSSSAYSGGIVVFGEMIFADQQKIVEISVEIYSTVCVVAKYLETLLDGEFLSVSAKYREDW